MKVDADTKKKAQRVAKQLGLSVSAIVNAHLKELVRTKRVSVSAKPGYRMTPYLEKIIEEAEADLAAGRNIDGPFSTDEELDEYFNAPLRTPKKTSVERKKSVRHSVHRRPVAAH